MRLTVLLTLAAALPALAQYTGSEVIRGPGYAPGRIALVNASGTLDSVVGPTAYCVTVEGSAIPCGIDPLSFVDTETPSGRIDGVNRVFALQQVPIRGSLLLFRNGLLQRQEADYALVDLTVTFVPAAIPQPGDILQASYRTTGEAAGRSIAKGASVRSPNKEPVSTPTIARRAQYTNTEFTVSGPDRPSLPAIIPPEGQPAPEVRRGEDVVLVPAGETALERYDRAVSAGIDAARRLVRSTGGTVLQSSSPPESSRAITLLERTVGATWDRSLVVDQATGSRGITPPRVYPSRGIPLLRESLGNAQLPLLQEQVARDADYDNRRRPNAK